jgi:hypothetical protein
MELRARVGCGERTKRRTPQPQPIQFRLGRSYQERKLPSVSLVELGYSGHGGSAMAIVLRLLQICLVRVAVEDEFMRRKEICR